MPQCRPSRGFTLVELIVTVLIVAILTAIALPSFRATIRENRVATATNEMIAGLNLARTEAMRAKGLNGARLCASADGTNCGTTWTGWVVWTDADGDNTFDAQERVRAGQISPTVNVTSGVNVLQFDRRGMPVGAVPTFSVAPSDCPSGQQLVRSLTLTGSGQIKSEKTPCG